MNFIVRFLRPPAILGVVAAGLFSATTLVVFSLFGWSILLAVLVLITLGLVVIIVYLTRQLQAARAAEEIEKTITQQADQDIERSLPGQQAEAQSMKAELLAALDALKKSRMGRHGQGALSLLPWYLVLGPRDAGKGALIRRSGLHFALVDESQNPRSVRGVGGTRSLEWWLSEDAVFLDLAGRSVGAAAQFEDNDDWFAFLGVLRKVRKDRPINGLVVAMPCDQFGERDEAKVEKTGLAVRERILEVMERLGVRPPVYVVFTKVDRLAGFAEFFGDLDASGRTQPWGATIAPERTTNEDPVAIFDAEFEHLRAALSDRRMARMANIPDPVQRARAFAFPLQLESLRPGMRRFLKVVFQPGKQQDAALFRGFYYASAVQQGPSVDRVLKPAADSLGTTAPDTASPPLAGEGAYFVHELVTRVLFGDRALTGTTTREETARRRRRILVFAGLAVALLGFGILLVTLATINGALIGQVRHAAQAAESITPANDLARRIEVLEALRDPTRQLVELKRRKPFWRVLSGYSGDQLADTTLHLYTEKLLELMIAPSFVRLETELSDLTRTNHGAFYDYYVLFRAWRVLSKPDQIIPEDATLLARETNRVLEQELQHPSPQEREHLARLMADQVSFIVENPRLLPSLREYYYTIRDGTLFGRARERVRRTWDPSAFYAPIVSDAAERVPAVTLATLIKTPGFLNSTGKVDGPFTLEGWKRVRTRIEGWRAQMQRDWVIREIFENPPDLATDLEGRYARDYTQQWLQFMNGVSTTVEANPVAVSGLLKQAMKDDSPILNLLRAIREQTSLGTDAASATGAIQTDFAFVQGFAASGGPMGGLWQALRRQGRTDASAPKEKLYLDELRRLQEAVERLGAPSELRNLCGSGAAATAAVEWVNDLGAQQSNRAGTGPATRLLTLPVRAFCGKVVIDSTTRVIAALNQSWGPIHQRFQQTLAGKYPCAATGADATKQDFDNFFHPGSVFWAFVQNDLRGIVNEDGSLVAGATIQPSVALRACVQRAYAIREALFAGNQSLSSLTFSMLFKPVIEKEGPPVSVGRAALDIGGTSAFFYVGVPNPRDFQWPGAAAGQGATLRIETVGQAATPVSAPGVWGLFRILDRATVTGGETPTATWRVTAGPTVLKPSFEIHPNSAIHPFRPGSLRISLPPRMP